MKVFGQIEKVQYENLTADPTGTGLVPGRFWFRTDTNELKYYDGTVVRVVANLDQSQVFTNKDYDGGTASNTSRLTAPKADLAVLEALTRKEATILFDSTSKKFFGDDGTELTELGGGGSGGARAWLEGANADFESGTGDYATYKDSAAALPDDGLGGVSTITIATTQAAGEVLAGTQSLKITKPASNVQGEGVAVDFQIDPLEQGREQDIPFMFKTGTGYVANFYRVFVYDVTNARLINVLTSESDGSIPVSQSNGSKFVGRFVASSDSTSYRLIFHATSTDATGFDLLLDQVLPQPKSFFVSPVIDDWTAWTPTGAYTTGVSYSGHYRQVGGNLEVYAKVDFSAAPTPAATTFRLDLPPGFTIDSSKVATFSNNRGAFGSAVMQEGGVRVFVGTVGYNNTTSVRLHHSESGNAGVVSDANPFAVGSSDAFAMHFTVPVLEFNNGAVLSTTQVGAEKVAAVVDGSGTGTTFINGSWTDVDNLTNVIEDKFGIFSGSTLTAPYDGLYQITAKIHWPNNSSGQRGIALGLNGADNTYGIVFGSSSVAGSSGQVMSGTRIIRLNAGDTITVQGFQDSGGNLAAIAGNGTNFQVERLSDFSSFGVFSEHEYIEVDIASRPTAQTGGVIVYTTEEMTIPPGTWDIGYNVPARIEAETQDTTYAGHYAMYENTTVIEKTQATHLIQVTASAETWILETSAKRRITFTEETTIRMGVQVNDTDGFARIEDADFTSSFTGNDSAAHMWARRVK